MYLCKIVHIKSKKDHHLVRMMALKPQTIFDKDSILYLKLLSFLQNKCCKTT